MSNNIVVLMGWLEVESVEHASLDGSAPQPLIQAWIYTHKPSQGGKHPLVIDKVPAEITLAWAKKSDPQAGPPQVVVKGELLSLQGRTVVHVKTIHFVGALDPAVQRLLADLAQIVAHKDDSQLRPALLDLLRQSGELSEMFELALENSTHA